MLVSLRTPKGESIDMNLSEDVTIGDLKSILITEFGYVRSVQVMYGTRIVKDDVFVDEFPAGSLIVVGSRVTDQPQRQFQPEMPQYNNNTYQQQQQQFSSPSTGYSRGGRQQQQGHEPSPYSIRGQQANHAAHHQQQQQHPYHVSEDPSPQHSSATRRAEGPAVHLNHHHDHNPPQPRFQAPPATSPQAPQQQHRNGKKQTPVRNPVPPFGAPQPDHLNPNDASSTPCKLTPRGTTTITVNAIVPALDDRTVQISISDDATVDEFLKQLAAIEPSTAGCKMLFFGKYIRDRAQSIRAVPLKDQSEVMIASGPYLSDNMMTLYLAERSIREVQGYIAAEAEGGDLKTVPKEKRNHWNEILMKSLLNLDALVDVEGEMRLKRKEYVKAITALQDSLAF